MMATVAEQEAETISKRTSAALQAAKAHGKVLGGRRVTPGAWKAIAQGGRALAAEVRTANAKAFSVEVGPVIAEFRRPESRLRTESRRSLIDGERRPGAADVGLRCRCSVCLLRLETQRLQQ